MTKLDLVGRFEQALCRLEGHLRTDWIRTSRGAQPDLGSLLAWAGTRHLLNRDVEVFLHDCRRARNAYAHVSFTQYDGPIGVPPEPVVQRLERILAQLQHPRSAGEVAPAAVTCRHDTPVHQALHQMHAEDFSQLPYQSAAGAWLLVTFEQVARWIAVEADIDGTTLVDLSTTVGALATHPSVGAVTPRLLAASAPLSTALDELEQALQTPDSAPGGYPFLVVLPRKAGNPQVLATDDLPDLYDWLGR